MSLSMSLLVFIANPSLNIDNFIAVDFIQRISNNDGKDPLPKDPLKNLNIVPKLHIATPEPVKKKSKKDSEKETRAIEKALKLGKLLEPVIPLLHVQRDIPTPSVKSSPPNSPTIKRLGQQKC